MVIAGKLTPGKPAHGQGTTAAGKPAPSQGTTDDVCAALTRAIKPHVVALRNNMFGKKIPSKTYPKYRK
ncbi:hypothetical protein GUJ93_ZPchr0009g1216 [Zizania palustris]|uniref:Uncharacterized protein n=1 Tax=Zizania palustris TaxID=103762 RepID=A0A8J5V8H5_ZIZPA|nr:hypothetical protein GUJ93_ZPchr0009g1216 [Zizania palustris]